MHTCPWYIFHPTTLHSQCGDQLRQASLRPLALPCLRGPALQPSYREEERGEEEEEEKKEEMCVHFSPLQVLGSLPLPVALGHRGEESQGPI